MNLGILGEKIRQRREARGLKQIDIANALQISSQAVSKWERGENAPDISILPNLAKLLGVSTDWLLGSYDTDKDVFEATVLVTSVLGYADKARSLQLREVATWANTLLFQLTETVLRMEGVPIKQTGDGLLCFFSETDHRQRAIDAALQMARISSEKLKIALSTGPVYLGSLGHPDYASLDIMGDAVNIAFFAIRWLDREERSGIVATASLVEEVGNGNRFGEKQRLEISFLPDPIDVYEVLS